MKRLMKWTDVEENSEPQPLKLDENESVLELHELRQGVFNWSKSGER